MTRGGTIRGQVRMFLAVNVKHFLSTSFTLRSPSSDVQLLSWHRLWEVGEVVH